MSENNSTIRFYDLPQSFPCGPQSSCCGPVGQSNEELGDYMIQLESSLPGIKLQTIDMSQELNLGRDLPRSKSWRDSVRVALCKNSDERSPIECQYAQQLC